MTTGWRIRRTLAWGLSAALTVALFYLLAGRWDLPWLWAVAAVASAETLVLNHTMSSELLRERLRPGPGGIDRLSRVLLAGCVTAEVVVATLDVGRFHWSDAVSPAVHAAGLILFAGGFGLVVWAIAVNRFFSSVVRIQSDRGHQLITTGPYGYVRHPGYLGMLVGYPMIGLAIGSWWSLVPALGSVLAIARRLRIEDRYLLEHLAGYADYATTVPSRIVPGIW